MINVLHMIETSEPGGAETVLAYLASHLDPSRYRSLVVLLERDWLDKKLDELGVPYVIIPNERAYDPGFMWRLLRLINKEQIDIIHSHEFMMTVYGALVGRLSLVPAIGTIHGKNYYPDKESRRRFLRMALTMLSRLIAVSRDLEDFIATTIDSKGHEKLITIYNGIDVNKYDHLETSADVRVSLDIPFDAVVGVTVGALFPVKGLNYLLEAVSKLREGTQPFRMLVAGEGKEREPLQQQAQELGIAEMVRFTGFRDDIPELLSVADFYVCSSLSEGLSLSIMEAMAVGKPVIATAVGGNPELVNDGENGFLVRSQDADALAERMDMLRMDPELVKTMGARGRSVARTTFSLETMIHNYQQLYARLCR